MRVIIAGVPTDMADEYAARMIEQGKATPAPPAPPVPRAEKPKGKRKDVSEHEPKNAD